MRVCKCHGLTGRAGARRRDRTARRSFRARRSLRAGRSSSASARAGAVDRRGGGGKGQTSTACWVLDERSDGRPNRDFRWAVPWKNSMRCQRCGMPWIAGRFGRERRGRPERKEAVPSKKRGPNQGRAWQVPAGTLDAPASGCVASCGRRGGVWTAREHADGRRLATRPWSVSLLQVHVLRTS